MPSELAADAKCLVCGRGLLLTFKSWKPTGRVVVEFWHGPGAAAPEPCTKLYTKPEADWLEAHGCI